MREFFRGLLCSTLAFSIALSPSFAAAQSQPAAQPPPPSAPPPAEGAAPAEPAPAPAPAQPYAPPPAPVPPPPPGPPEGYIPIEIQGRSNSLRMELKLMELYGNPSYVDRTGGVRCQGSCRLDVPPGVYRLRVIEPDGRRSERTLKLREPERLMVGPIDDGARTTGLVMGIIGTVMVPTGLYMMIRGSENAEDDAREGRSDGSNGQLVLYGLMTFLTGAALAPVGWVIYARSGRFTLDRDELGSREASVPRFDVGVGPLPGGGMLGGSFSF